MNTVCDPNLNDQQTANTFHEFEMIQVELYEYSMHSTVLKEILI